MKIFIELPFSMEHQTCMLPETITPSPACSTLWSGVPILAFLSSRYQERSMKTGASKIYNRNQKLTMLRLEIIGKTFTGLLDIKSSLVSLIYTYPSFFNCCSCLDASRNPSIEENQNLLHRDRDSDRRRKSMTYVALISAIGDQRISKNIMFKNT